MPSECRALASVARWPANLTHHQAVRLRRCIALQSIALPESVATIRRYAFLNCTALTSIALPESVTTIHRWAFTRCAALDAPSRERIRAVCPDAMF